MSKVILFLTLLAFLILFSFGIVDPNSPVVWLASTSTAFAWLRLALMLVLGTLLITNPPRNLHLRIFIGILSSILITWAITGTYENSMKFLDTFSLLAFSISSLLIVLELEDFSADETSQVPQYDHQPLMAQ